MVPVALAMAALHAVSSCSRWSCSGQMLCTVIRMLVKNAKACRRLVNPTILLHDQDALAASSLLLLVVGVSQATLATARPPDVSEAITVEQQARRVDLAD